MARTTIRKMTALLLAAIVVLALLPGCQDKSRDIPYSTAFITPSAPKGYATPDTIAFYTEDEAGNPVAENVSPEEIAAFSAEMKTLPRTVYFNRFLPENLR